MKVAAVGEKVEVTTETPPVEPTRTEVSQVIDAKQVGSLPISGRLFTDFALLTPGVTTGRTSLQSTITETEVTRISFGGMRDLSNLVTVDGADTINSATGSQRATPSQEAVSEFRVVNNGFSAEQGRAMGGIVNIITKSGGNDLHGSLYDYMQNSGLNAHNLLQQGILPVSGTPVSNALRQNQFGGTLGGPIKKDKTFYFMNYEGQRRGEAAIQSPSLMSNFVLVNYAKSLLGLAPEEETTKKTADTDRGLIKLDHELTKSNRVAIRYNIEDGRSRNVLVGDTLDGGGLGASSSGHHNLLRDQAIVGTLTSQLSSSLINTAMVQYARRKSAFPGATGQPNLDLPNFFMLGHNFGVFDETSENRIQFSDNVSWVKGSHLVKFGTDFNHVKDHIIWPGFSPMRIVLPGVNCLVDFANYVNSLKPVPGAPAVSNFAEGPCPMALGPQNAVLPPFPGVPGPNPADFANGVAIVFWPSPLGSADNSVVDGSIAPPVNTNFLEAYPANQTPNYFSEMSHGYFGLFLQDQWRVSPKLTLNYGVRWDMETGIGDVVNNYYKAFQPRVGFAYSPDKHTVIRGGFGLFSDRYNTSFFFVTRPQRPTTFCLDLPACATKYPFPGIRDGGYNATYALNQVPFIAPGVTPWGQQPADLAANLIQFGTYGPVALVTNPANVTPTFPGGEISSVGDGTVERNSKMPYALQGSFEIDREVGHGLVINAGYLFVSSHHQVRAENLNVCPENTTGGASPSATTGWYQCGSPAFGNYTTPLPGFPAGKSWFQSILMPVGLIYYTDNSGNSVYHGVTLSGTEKISNHFRLNANYTFSKTLDDGTFTTFVSTPEDLYRRYLERANSNQDVRHRFVANFTMASPTSKGTNIAFRDWEFSGIVTLQGARPFTIFVGHDTNNDTNPVTDRVGLSARNTYWGDKFKTTDIRLSRSFSFREKQKLELAADFFNFLNRNNVDEIDTVYGTYGYCGAVPHSYGDATTTAIQNVNPLTDTSCYAAGVFAGPPFPNPDFGRARKVFNARQVQLSFKFTF
jgi:hypothetical protein